MSSFFLSVLRVAGLCTETSSQDRSSLFLSLFEEWLVYVDSLLDCCVHRGNQLIGQVICVVVCVKGGWFQQTHLWNVVFTEETSSQDRSSLQLSVSEGWLVHVDSLLDSSVHRGNQLTGQVIFVFVCVWGVQAGLSILTVGLLCTQGKLPHRTGHLCSCLRLRSGWFMQTQYWTVVYTEETSSQDRSSLQLSV